MSGNGRNGFGASGKNIFISYRRSADRDRQLANFLKSKLEQAGYSVFIDTDIKVGMDWASEINRRIVDWCDYFMVLLSENSITSEMVKGEIRTAHQAKRNDGWPAILPIRVAYDGSLDLDYELDSYLGPLQYLHWDGADDPQCVLDGLLEAISPRDDYDSLHFEHESIEDTHSTSLCEAPSEPFKNDVSEQRPAAKTADRSVLFRAPGGACKIDDPLYIMRRPDSILEKLSAVVGETIVIKAPRQMGKSSLLTRYLEGCYQANKSIIELRFQIFTDVELENYPTFLRRIASEIQRNLGLSDPDVDLIDSQIDFDHFLRDHILALVDGPITFAFDGVDRILGQSYQHDFFSMLRTWHNDRAGFRSLWAEVDLALVIATDPYLLIKNSDRSPFNVTDPIELCCLDRVGVSHLNEQYHHPLSEKQLDQLFDLLSGHPHLTRLAFYRLVGQGMTFSKLIETAEFSDGPFGDHLRALLLLLQQQPQLLADFKTLIRDNRWQPDQETYYRLHSAGLACRRKGRIAPANQLYAKFFGQVQ